MTTLTEKIEASKQCCRKVKDYILEKKLTSLKNFFNGDWEVFVIKRNEKTGKFVGKTACCAHCCI